MNQPTPFSSCAKTFHEKSLWLKVGLYIMQIWHEDGQIRAEQVHLETAKISRWICHPCGNYNRMYWQERTKYEAKKM